ncbi:MAG: ABC transporter permease [Firmicutes bacterium]|nr:ABC transporter permease [Bacillota bacterium]
MSIRAVYTIWLRDVIRFFRERTRIAAMLGQPLLYLLVVGNGLAATLIMPGAPEGFNYVHFMFPGIIGMSVLFTSIYSAISIVWDREFGFLKEVLVAPVPRWSVAVGKAMGGTTASLVQCAVLLLLAPLIGIPLTFSTVLKLAGVLFLLAFALTSLGIAIASRIDTMEGFQIVMNFLIMPLFFLSGAMFPLHGVPGWMEVLMRLNPLTYGVDALRNIIYTDMPGAGHMVQFTLAQDLLVVAVMAALFAGAGALALSRRE